MSDLDHQAEYWNSTGAVKTFTHPLEPSWLSQLEPDARILDYGCGYGRLVGELHQRGFEVAEGADPSPGLIARAQQQWPQARFTLIDTPPTLPRPDASFDAILLFAVLTCIPTDAGQHALVTELRRLLRPGGLLYLSDMCLQDDERNRARYQEFSDRYGVYGIFETSDGAVFRHHEPSRLRGLLTGFDQIATRQVPFETMNGHPAQITQILAQKSPESQLTSAA